MPPSRATPRAAADYIPVHLRPFVFHSQDDFYVSRHFDPLLLSHLMYAGFLPIASDVRETCFLLPKLHKQRCVLLFQPELPEHVPKSMVKKAKKYKFVLNRNFHAVVAGCHEKHGIPWLYPPLVKSFETLFDAGEHRVESCPGPNVRLVTVEIYDVATETLVAGELGYTVGSVYTSLTGFSRANGAGTVQLHALSKFLYLAGFKMWDLGMSMDYKMSLGAKDVERDDFLDELYKWRDQQVEMTLDESREEGDVRVGVVVKTLFDISRPRTETMDEWSKKGTHALRDQNLVEAVASGEKDKSDDDRSRARGKEDAMHVKREVYGEKRKAASDDGQRGEEKRGKM
uniref:Leucyl/phenylalanyl-tRNA--protein transferase n=1 Tax=Peronospora matthiolae TaxID=2874970 RepID=A0AAV1U0F3_9STRA